MFLVAFNMMSSICRRPRENFSARFERFKEALGALDVQYKITKLEDVMRLCTSKDTDHRLERVLALDQENKRAAAAELAVWLESSPTRWNVLVPYSQEEGHGRRGQSRAVGLLEKRR